MHKILIANRGEVARRIIRSARALGRETVAIFSTVDADSTHVREADVAVLIKAPAPYLHVDGIIDAAQRTGATAVHPGYGFLAENPRLAQACADASLNFIGPPAPVIAALGHKANAKAIAQRAGVPIVPGDDKAADDVETARAACDRLGYPVVLKANAGGGGIGMRVVRTPEQLPHALEAARREAQSAFGDGRLLLERCIDSPRHIEFQILADTHGNVVHLFERECSIQRRHQKIIEETPSPALDEALRQRMGDAAVSIAKAAGYVNAGTVEFIVDGAGRFYFLEVNTRLQVEHALTEEVTGIDLVAQQIRIAGGAPLPFAQKDIPFVGAALECRIYAEDPAQGFLPTSGEVTDWHLPAHVPVRVESSIEGPCQVPIDYDPMLAKLITHGANREEARHRMRYALQNLSVQGIVCNRVFLQRVLDDPRFVHGDYDTHLIETHPDLCRAHPLRGETLFWGAIAVAVAAYTDNAARRTLLPRIQGGYRNNPWGPQSFELRCLHEDANTDNQHTDIADTIVHYEAKEEGRLFVRCGSIAQIVHCRERTPDMVTFVDADGLLRRYRLRRCQAGWIVHGHGISTTFTQTPRDAPRHHEAIDPGCVAPMPGAVVQVLVSPGESVEEGDTLVLLEAMKMEHRVRADRPGVVERVLVGAGDLVSAKQPLVQLGS